MQRQAVCAQRCTVLSVALCNAIEGADEKYIRMNEDGSYHYPRRCNFPAIRLEVLETTKIISDDTHFPLTKYYLGEQTKRNEKDADMWHAWGEMRGSYRVSVGKCEGKRPFERSRRR